MKKKILICLICLVLCGLTVVSVYKFKPDAKLESSSPFTKVNIDKKYYGNNDESNYDFTDKIVSNDTKSISFNYFNSDESITGEVFIDSNGYLYITDSNKNMEHMISTKGYKSLYYKEYDNYANVYVYLLLNDGSICVLVLDSNDIKNAKVYGYNSDKKYTNFVDIDYSSDMYTPVNSIFALSTDGNVYDVNSGIKYDETIISLYSAIYVINDNSMVTNVGNIIQDKDGNNYKIKYIFNLVEDKDEVLDNGIYLIVTQDNKFIYFNDLSYVYEFDKFVKDISFDVYYPYIDGNLSITFEDDYKMDFIARCNEYYCPNEFVE